MTPDLLAVVVRGLGFVALFQAVGAAFFLAVFGKQTGSAGMRIHGLGRIAAAAGVVLLLVHLLLQPARMAGDFAGLWDRDLQRLAWTSKGGVAQVMQLFGLLVVAAALGVRARAGALAASLGGAISIAAFLLTGHTSAHPLRWVLAPLLALHLLIVAFWFGALVPLAWVIRAQEPAKAARLVERFSAMATVLVPLIALAGIAMAWILAGNLTVLRQPYGALLIVKFAGFVLLMLLAGYNKWRLTPSLLTTSAEAAPALQRTIAVEYLLIVLVLGVTAALTSLFSPDQGSAA